MPGILDRIAAQRFSQFLPQTVPEFFALQLARKLGEPEAARHFLELLEERSEESLLVAYRRAVAASGDHRHNIALNFHTALGRLNGHGPSLDNSRLLAIKVERRTVSVALFAGTHIEDTGTRHLSSVRSKAERSAMEFIQWFTGNLEVESAAVEQLRAGKEAQRSVLLGLVSEVLREHFLPIWAVPKTDLVASFAHPEPRSRREIRDITRSIWPVLSEDGGILDAASLGLYVQTERLFSTPVD